MSCLKSLPPCGLLVFTSLFTISISANGQVSLTGNPVNFGSVQLGTNLIQPLVLTNTGRATVTVNGVAVSGTGFAFVGPTLPIVLGSQKSVALSVSFLPQTTGSVSGSATVRGYVSWGGKNRTRYGGVTVTLSGSGYSTTPGYLTAPPSLNLGSVIIGGSQSQMLTISNTGGSGLTISGANVSGSGYSVNGLTFPYTLAPGASAGLSVVFAPTITGTNNATLTLASNASDPSVAIALTGSGTSSSGTISVAPSALDFGSVTIGGTQSQGGTLTATGGSVTLSSTSSSNSAFTLAGVNPPLTLSAGQSVPYTVTFTPTAAGAASAKISFFTSNSNSALETASGSGATIQHSVNLWWNASTSSSISGYNVYRGASPSGPFSRINPAVSSSLSYSDNAVQSGTTYYYVTTAVDASGAESSYSNQVTAAVPFP
jgi:Abnormal spindle-like microcephaly-assoc'd, ASPM-SPD-2-Hydin